MCLVLKCPSGVHATQLSVLYFPGSQVIFWVCLHFAENPLRERHFYSWCNLIMQEMVNEFQCVQEAKQQQSRQIPSSAYSDCPKYQLEPLCLLPRFTHISSASNRVCRHIQKCTDMAHITDSWH